MLIRQASPDEIDEVVAIDVDACGLYAQAGLHLELGPEHPYSRDERAGWLRAARDGNVFLAEPPGARPVGLLVMDRVGTAAFLDQLSVRMSAMRQGLGRRLLMYAIERAAGESLWLTTYAHIPWNRPVYERHGFAVVADADCPPGIVAMLEHQRRWLPDPDQRIAMLRRVAPL